jgi:hypothetical protein
MGHVSISAQDTMPMEFYEIDAPAAQSPATPNNP